MFDRIMFFFSQIFELLHIYIRGPHKCVLYFRWSGVSQFWAVYTTNHKQSYATVFNSGSLPQLQRLLFSNLLVLFTESRKRYGAKVVFLFCLQSCKGLLQTIAFSKRIYGCYLQSRQWARLFCSQTIFLEGSVCARNDRTVFSFCLYLDQEIVFTAEEPVFLPRFIRARLVKRKVWSDWDSFT